MDPGPIDGVMGPKTMAALKAFQKDQKLTESGRLDDQTREKLGVPADAPRARRGWVEHGGRRRPAPERPAPAAFFDANPHSKNRPNGHAAASPLVARNVGGGRPARGGGSGAADRSGALLGRHRADGRHGLVRGHSTSSGSRGWIAWNAGLVPGWRPDRSVSLQLPHVRRVPRGDLPLDLRPDQPEQPHPAERAPGASRSPDQSAWRSRNRRRRWRCSSGSRGSSASRSRPIPSERELAAPTDIREVVSTLDARPGTTRRSETSGREYDDDGGHDPRTRPRTSHTRRERTIPSAAPELGPGRTRPARPRPNRDTPRRAPRRGRAVGLVPAAAGAQGEAPSGHADARRRARPPRRANGHGAAVAGRGLPRLAGSRIPPRLLPGYLVSVTPAGRRADAVGRGGPGRRSGRAGRPSSPPTSRAGSSRGAPCRARAWTSRARCGSKPAPGDRGTEIKVILTYAPPAGKLGAAAAALGGRRRRSARPRGAAPIQAAAWRRARSPRLHATRDGPSDGDRAVRSA